MSDVHTNLMMHVLFGTAAGHPPIAAKWRLQLWSRLGRIVEELGATTLAVGGTADHVHLLIRYLPTQVPDRLIDTLQTRSAEWIRTTRGCPTFRWSQEWYIFTTDEQAKPAEVHAILHQEAIHRHCTFAEECDALCRDCDLPPAFMAP